MNTHKLTKQFELFQDFWGEPPKGYRRELEDRCRHIEAIERGSGLSDETDDAFLEEDLNHRNLYDEDVEFADEADAYRDFNEGDDDDGFDGALCYR